MHCKRVFGQGGHWIPGRFPYFFIAILRFCAFRYRSVTLKCGVDKPVAGLTNGGRCFHGAISPSVELSPMTSGTRSGLSDGRYPYLEGCEWVVKIAPWLAHPARNGRGVLIKRLGMTRHEGGDSQSGGTLWAERGIGLWDFNYVDDGQWPWPLALPVRSGSHLGGGGHRAGG